MRTMMQTPPSLVAHAPNRPRRDQQMVQVVEFDDAALRVTATDAGDNVPALCARWMAEYLERVDKMARDAVDN